jgi:hypothetical protein
LIVPRAQIVERSPADLPHLHVVTRKPDVDTDLFERACGREGLGVSRIQRVREEPRAMARYAYKSVLPAPGEEFMADPSVLEDFLVLNAGRVIHTRGEFWIQDRSGVVFPNASEAYKAARREWRRGRD